MNKTLNIRATELAEALRSIPEAILASADEALNLTRVKAQAEKLCPVKTGALRDTIRVHRPSNTEATLTAGGNGVTYAEAVHDGTSRQTPRPFLLQALQSEVQRIAQMIAQDSVTRL